MSADPGPGRRPGSSSRCPPRPSSGTPSPSADAAGCRPGVEANGYAEGTETPPDLKESFAVGADQPTGDAEVDGYWFQPNVWPAEVPALQLPCAGYLARMRALADELLVICAAALGLDAGLLHPAHDARHAHDEHQLVPADGGRRPARTRPVPDRPAHRLRHRHHPRPRTGPGRPAGVDRGGRLGGRALHPGRFTINTGDLLARWSGDRWMSNRHRVLPPQAEAPDEDLVSLVYFYEADHDALIESLQPPIGKPTTTRRSSPASSSRPAWTRSLWASFQAANARDIGRERTRKHI